MASSRPHASSRSLKENHLHGYIVSHVAADGRRRSHRAGDHVLVSAPKNILEQTHGRIVQALNDKVFWSRRAAQRAVVVDVVPRLARLGHKNALD